MTNITLIGPGAIGSTLAAWLSQNRDHRVTVAARTPFDSIVLDAPGGRLEASPRVLTDPAQARSGGLGARHDQGLRFRRRGALVRKTLSAREHAPRRDPERRRTRRTLRVLCRCGSHRAGHDRLSGDAPLTGRVTQGGPIHIVVPAGSERCSVRRSVRGSESRRARDRRFRHRGLEEAVSQQRRRSSGRVARARRHLASRGSCGDPARHRASNVSRWAAREVRCSPMRSQEQIVERMRQRTARRRQFDARRPARRAPHGDRRAQWRHRPVRPRARHSDSDECAHGGDARASINDSSTLRQSGFCHVGGFCDWIDSHPVRAGEQYVVANIPGAL